MPKIPADVESLRAHKELTLPHEAAESWLAIRMALITLIGQRLHTALNARNYQTDGKGWVLAK